MAIIVRLKEKHGIKYYSAKLYDPNMTLAHKRVVLHDLKDLSRLSWSDFLTPRLMSIYFRTIKAAVLRCYDNPQAYTPDSTEVYYPEKKVSRPKNRGDFSAKDLLYCCLQQFVDSAPIVQEAIQEVLRDRKLSDEEKKECLAVKEDGVPGLSLAFLNGYTANVATFIKLILESGLALPIKEELIVAKDVNGVPGLSMALKNGHAETVAAALEPILGSGFDKSTKAALVAAKSAGGVPGLMFAFQGGHTETVAVALKFILKSDLDPAIKAELIAAKAAKEISGLYMAFQSGHVTTVAAALKLILESDLDPAVKAELIAAKSANGVPGLRMALQQGHAETVASACRLILESDLDPVIKADLSAAKLPNGTPGLFLALHNHRMETIKVYFECVLNLGLKSKAFDIHAPYENIKRYVESIIGTPIPPYHAERVQAEILKTISKCAELEISPPATAPTRTFESVLCGEESKSLSCDKIQAVVPIAVL